jgi:mortality factor 4-like protein 1
MSAPYNVNERVLCFHGPLIYEAKVLQSEHHDEPAPLTGKVGWHYFVHYKGWKQKYVLAHDHLCG